MTHHLTMLMVVIVTMVLATVTVARYTGLLLKIEMMILS